ncbi:ATP-binding protein [Paracoccus marcusii]|uniref:ATP-binding protein n=1 Tax=Paracoccus marcusii TaxID=59779 RepID=UPI002492E42E|nr:ATP-binding protein [Paracoccus marcusii]
MTSIQLADATPHAASLIEGMRDFGYTLETAMADVIDNSVTAGSSVIHILADTTSDDPWIAIQDNGTGMTKEELIEAMRPGSRNPLDKRFAHDLGRFGLGLKSASFSQCRMLTVVSRKDDSTAAATWDLDEVSRTNRWDVQVEDDPVAVPATDRMAGSGTVVLWRKLDRLSTNFRHDAARRSTEINAALSGAEHHLRLCFHRYMEGAKPQLKLYLNGRRLEPIDPFASTHMATQIGEEERLPLSNGDVVTQSFTLPHHGRVTKMEWDELGGPEGHLRSQGFYVYRERRLIIAGGWLGLARATELTKLARVRVDIPNTMDADWKIDVRKASAQMPPVVRDRLRRIVERMQGTSKRTYQKRGRKLVDEVNMPLWNRFQKDGSIIYRPNADHPAVTGFIQTLPEEFRNGFRTCITLLGAGLPVAALHADMLGSAESVEADRTDFEEIAESVEQAVTTLLATGMKKNEVLRALCTTEPLIHHKERIRALLEGLQEK